MAGFTITTSVGKLTLCAGDDTRFRDHYEPNRVRESAPQPSPVAQESLNASFHFVL